MGSDPPNLLPGTLERRILKTLVRGPQHGYAVAQRLKDLSDDVLQVGESSLYPGRTRYYTLTAAGRKQLAVERHELNHLILAIQKVLNAT